MSDFKPFPLRQTLCWAVLGFAILTASPLSPYLAGAQANSEFDRKYALETIGTLRAWDNVDGLFGDYVDLAFKEYFARQSRFVVQDLSKADPLLQKSKIPYAKLIDDPEILGRLSRTFRAQSIIKTKIAKEGSQYRVTMTWMLSPHMEVMATETFLLVEPTDGKGFSKDDINKSFAEGLDKMISKVPFYGTLTGRDQEAVTINIGANAGLEKGDTLLIGTLDEVKKHPLLKEIVDWRFSQTGRVIVDHVEDRITFGKVEQDEHARPIARNQKVIQIIRKPAVAEPVVIDEHEQEMARLREIPKLGWVSGGLMFLNFSRQFSAKVTPATGGDPVTVGKNGGGILFGPKTEGQLWLTREWFVEGAFSYGMWSHTQTELATGKAVKIIGSDGVDREVGAVSGSYSSLKVAVGYSYLLSPDLFGTKGWIKMGLRNIRYSLPTSDPLQLGASSFKVPLVGVGAELPMRGNYGALINLEFGVFSSATNTGVNSKGVAAVTTASTASDAAFFLGGYYRYTPRMTFRLGVDVQTNGLDIDATTTSLNHKSITILPSVQYYF